MDSRMMSSRTPTWVLLGLLAIVGAHQLVGAQQTDIKQGAVHPQSDQSAAGQVNYGHPAGASFSALVSGSPPAPLNDYASNLVAGFGGGVAGAKRARKMSAFMPMRGRKDGRDSPAGGWLGVPEVGSNERRLFGRQLAATSAPAGFSEAEGDSLSYFRLLAAPSMDEDEEQQQQRRRGSGWSAERSSPRRFASQIASMAAQQQQQQPSSSAERAQFGGGVADEGSLLALGPLMQAKLRRAFHPMRGKKSLPVAGGWPLSEAELMWAAAAAAEEAEEG